MYTYKPFKFTCFDTRLRILILCAHPDDESIFDSRDILHNNCTVICLTTPVIEKRREEFIKVLQITGQTGHILNFPDSIQTTFEGAAKSFQNSLANEGLLILAAIVVVYIV
jgi:LmbE family N-acetylglucosaminyl deacetylase